MSLHFAKLVFLSPIATGLRAVFAETADNQSVVMPKAHIGQAVAIPQNATQHQANEATENTL